ncbi:platelet-activating factor acetylhydrolase [Sarocladium implicatum]|nr:platelet-activating factor acetylhydrolase [Sarocladium implicatum]
MRVNINTTLLSALFVALSNATSIPPPTGRYPVGVRKEVIEYYNDRDPLAPNNISTSFLATIFYPTTQASTSDELPYLDPRTADVWEKIYGFAEGTIASLTSTLQPDAPFLKTKKCHGLYPTILFGPGAGGPATAANSILLSDLASHGYTVIGLDHPYEHEWLLYPNGTYIPGLPLDYGWGLPEQDEILALYNLRNLDAEVLLKQLPALKEKLGGAPINTTHVGTLGHSLGGAAALGQLFNNPIVKSGIDMDGSLFGRPALNSSSADVHKPSMLLGFEQHFDTGFATYPAWQTSYFRGIRVNGSTHNDFTDAAFWRMEGRDLREGEIEGERMVGVVRRLVREFFEYTLRGGEEGEAPPVLDEPEREFPELVRFDEDGPMEG